LANLGSESETCVGSRVRLVGVLISIEKNFYRLPFTPPLSGSPYRSFRELGKQARDRINADFNVNNPDTPPRASQKLIAAAMLLRAMPAPSTPEARNLHREVQALIEQAAVQQAESSASRIRQQGDARGDGAAQGANPQSMQAKRRGDPPTRDARRPRNGSSTRARRWTATPVMSSMLGVRARRMRERRQATTLDRVDATTAMRTVL
jgi:hypothetical protein